MFSGQHRDGCQTLLTHLRLNPRDPRNWRNYHLIAYARYLLGDYAGAIEADRRAKHENPNQTLSTPFPKYGDVFCADSGRYDQRILVEEDVACRGGALL